MRVSFRCSLQQKATPPAYWNLTFPEAIEASAALLESLVAQQIRPYAFEEIHTGLEELFLQLTKGEVA